MTQGKYNKPPSSPVEGEPVKTDLQTDPVDPVDPSPPKLASAPELAQDPVKVAIVHITDAINLLSGVNTDPAILAIGKLKGAIQRLT